MKYFVYALYSPSYEMVKIGRTKNFKKRWKDLSHWGFDEHKSFALGCNTNQGHKRIEATLKTFFNLHPSINALSTKQDGYTECFDERIIEELRYFFFHFSQHYPYGCSYINNIKPFIETHDFNFYDEDLPSCISSVKISTHSDSPIDYLRSIKDEDWIDF